MLVGVYLDPRQSSTTLKPTESGNYKAFVVVHFCQLHLIQPQIITNKQDKVIIITSFCRDFSCFWHLFRGTSLKLFFLVLSKCFHYATRIYGPLHGPTSRLLASAEDFGLWPRAFFALLAKKTLICCFGEF